MALCRQCQKRKAKRSCPALGSDLCSLCCGTLRERELHCPTSCRYLSEHKPYQEKRTLERRPEAPSAAGRERRVDERLSWLVFTAEAALWELARLRPGFTDRDAALAVAYAREKAARARSVLIVPGESHGPKSEAGEAVLRAVEACRYRPAGLITSTDESYPQEDRLLALDLVARTIHQSAGAEGRVYIQSLAKRFDEVRTASRAKKILMPR